MSFGRLKEERGAVLVIVAAAMTALVLIAALVIETGNWFEHKRHLQLQADAAALAGGAAFQLPGCSNTAIYAAVRKYAGVQDTTYTAPYNKQVGTTTDANAHVLVNSTTYWDSAGTNVDYTDGGSPCTASMVDVKMTETNLPWFFHLGVVPKINAHARVSVKLVDSLGGQMPIGVPDVNPQSGAVVFYDQGNPGNLSTTWAKHLRKINSGAGLNEWSNTDSSGAATPASVTMPPSGRLGAVMAFSSDGPPTRPPLNIAGMTVTQICAQARVDCYSSPSSSSLLFVHGEHGAPGNKLPVIQDAILETAVCPNTYAYFTYNDASCTATLRVNVATNGATLSNIELTATPGGNCGGGGTGSGTGNLRTFAITIPAHAGPCQITMTWIVKNETAFPSAPGIICGNNFNNNNPCNNRGGTPSFCPCPLVVQQAFGGNDDISGPIRTAHVLNMGGSFTDAFSLTCPGPLGWGAACNSFPIGSIRSLAADVQLAGAISTNRTDPPIFLRIVGGSQNGSLDCNITGNLRDQIAEGCRPRYAVNTDPNFACGSPPWTTKGDIFASNNPPYPCVAIQTGGSVGQFTQGIQDRILGGSNACPASGRGRNYWSLFPDLPDPDHDDPAYRFNDPRIIYVFMVPFGSFRGSGNDILPIVSFGIFYVRGWGGNGNGNDDPCPGAISAPTGDLVGNFITRVVDSGQGSGTQACVVGSFNPCVAVLTK
jgi:hypothetical protein